MLQTVTAAAVATAKRQQGREDVFTGMVPHSISAMDYHAPIFPSVEIPRDTVYFKAEDGHEDWAYADNTMELAMTYQLYENAGVPFTATLCTAAVDE